jgi:hypothetical protein
LYEPAEEGAVAVYVYDPLDRVLTVTMFVLHPNTNTIVSLPTPPPFAVRLPEAVNVVPVPVELGVDTAVSEVETGQVSEPDLRTNVIFPGPSNVTCVGSFEPEQARP